MSLNDIKINNHLLTELYSGVLVETQTKTFLGDNNKNIAILVASEEPVRTTNKDIVFLSSVLTACRLQLSDVVLIDQARQPVSYQQLSETFQSKVVILFGADPLSINLPIQFPYYQLQSFNQCTYLYAPALEEIEKNKSLKTQLWASLKQLFNL